MGLKKFDFNIKDNKKKKSIIVVSIIVLVLLVGITIYATYAAYKETKTYNIIQGKVSEFINADIALEIKLIDEDGNEIISNEFPPKKEYSYDREKSSCNNGSVITFDKDKWSATISSDKKDKCTMYFKYGVELAIKIKEQAMENNYLYNTTPDFGTVTVDGEYGLYSATDDYGTSYYFRGDAVNNFVKFGAYKAGSVVDGTTYTEETPMYWRIVRINGDGTIRLIFDGTEAKTDSRETHKTKIATTPYNEIAADPKYIGYTYDADGTETDSTVKGVVDAWYEDHFYKTKYEEYVVDRIFCNDRRVVSGSTTKYYGAYDRLLTNKSPVLTCTNKDDRYTVDDTTNGNGLLKYPVALITADEVAMAGTVGTNNNNTYYLLDSGYYLTMSPYYFNGTNAYIFRTGGGGDFGTGLVNNTSDNRGARPVINLSADVLFKGDGTVTTPYEIVTN